MNPSRSILFREGRTEDLDTLVRFNQAMALETENRTLDLTLIRSGVERALAQPEYSRYFVAVHENQVIGQAMVTFEWSNWRCGWFWWIQSVFVDTRFRNRGVFRKLYEGIQKKAQMEPDVCGIRLYVENENSRAQSVYQKLDLGPTGYQIYEQMLNTENGD